MTCVCVCVCVGDFPFVFPLAGFYYLFFILQCLILISPSVFFISDIVFHQSELTLFYLACLTFPLPF